MCRKLLLAVLISRAARGSRRPWRTTPPGVPVGHHDFGTGYASLNLLGQLAADILKIDRSLLAGFEYSPRSKTILRKVVEMAQDTEMVSICEGVETREQADYLLELGCDEAQGYFYYRPMPAEQFETTILRRRKADELLKN